MKKLGITSQFPKLVHDRQRVMFQLRELEHDYFKKPWNHVSLSRTGAR